MPIDAERREKVDFGPSYFVIESTYLVRSGSEIKSLSDVDRPNVRVIGIANTATIRAAGRSLSTIRPQRSRSDSGQDSASVVTPFTTGIRMSLWPSMTNALRWSSAAFTALFYLKVAAPCSAVVARVFAVARHSQNLDSGGPDLHGICISRVRESKRFEIWRKQREWNRRQVFWKRWGSAPPALASPRRPRLAAVLRDRGPRSAVRSASARSPRPPTRGRRRPNKRL